MLTVNVPLNTMLADLDETIRRLLRRSSSATVSRASRSRSTLRSRLVRAAHQPDRQHVPLRPARGRRSARASRQRNPRNGRTFETRTADGDRGLLRRDRVDAGRRGRAPAALPGARDLLRLPALPAGPARRPARERRPDVADQGPLGQGKGEKSDFWSASAASTRCRRLRRAALGRVRRELERRPGGPDPDRPHAALRRPGAARLEMHRPAARRPTRTGSRSPTRGSTLPEAGRWTSTDADGRFRFDRLPPGRHRARGADGGRPGGRRARLRSRAAGRPGRRKG